MIPTPERVGQSTRNWYVWIAVPFGGNAITSRDVRLMIVRKP